MESRAPRTRGNGEGSVYQEGAKKAREHIKQADGRRPPLSHAASEQ